MSEAVLARFIEWSLQRTGKVGLTYVYEDCISDGTWFSLSQQMITYFFIKKGERES